MRSLTGQFRDKRVLVLGSGCLNIAQEDLGECLRYKEVTINNLTPIFSWSLHEYARDTLGIPSIEFPYRSA